MFPFQVETQEFSAVEVLLGEGHREERRDGWGAARSVESLSSMSVLGSSLSTA